MSEILILILLLFQTLNLISASPPPSLDTFLSSLPLSDPLNANDSFLTLPSSLKKSLSRTLDPAFKLHISVSVYVKLAGSFSAAAPDTLASFISAAILDEFFSVLGVIEYGKEIEAAGELKHALEAIKWGTDYFIKAHTHPNVLWAEVGDGGMDHYCWQRPEDMTTSRKAYKIDSENPGSDLAGETAAAMVAALIVFRKINPHYSHLLLHHFQQLFEFGDKYRGSYDTSIGDVKSYYASVSGYRDELLLAALWL